MPSALDLTLAWTRAPWNALAFAGRRRLRWRKGLPALRNETKLDLFDYLDGEARQRAEAREVELRDTYGLQPLRRLSTRHDYRANVYLLDVLDELLGDLRFAAGPELRAVDVGAKSWNYVTALERFYVAASAGAVELSGIEIDGHGIYPDLHARADHGRAHATSTGNAGVQYQVADFLGVALAGVDVVTLLYPFVTRYALLRWGLPVHLYRPEAMFAKAFEVLRPEGLVVVVSQTGVEMERAVELARGAGGELVKRVAVRSRLVEGWEATQDRWATVWRGVGAGAGSESHTHTHTHTGTGTGTGTGTEFG